MVKVFLYLSQKKETNALKKELAIMGKEKDATEKDRAAHKRKADDVFQEMKELQKQLEHYKTIATQALLETKKSQELVEALYRGDPIDKVFSRSGDKLIKFAAAVIEEAGSRTTEKRLKNQLDSSKSTVQALTEENIDLTDKLDHVRNLKNVRATEARRSDRSQKSSVVANEALRADNARLRGINSNLQLNVISAQAEILEAKALPDCLGREKTRGRPFTNKFVSHMMRQPYKV